MKDKFIIKDWAGNICFHEKEFKTFDDAWEYIWKNDPCSEKEEEEGYYSDYYVEKIVRV